MVGQGLKDDKDVSVNSIGSDGEVMKHILTLSKTEMYWVSNSVIWHSAADRDCQKNSGTCFYVKGIHAVNVFGVIQDIVGCVYVRVAKGCQYFICFNKICNQLHFNKK